MAAIGAVHVDVVPSTESFVREMRAKVLEGADALGKELGKKIGDAATRPIADGINEGVNDRSTESTATKRGKATGQAFGRTLKAEIEKAIRSLPEIDLEADISDVERDLAEVKALLGELRDKKIGVNIGAGEALAEITALREELQSIHDKSVDVDIRYDTKRAAEQLGQLQRQIADETGGYFERTVRDHFDNAITQLPDIKLKTDASDADRTLDGIRTKLIDFAEYAKVNIHLNSAEVLAKTALLAGELRALADGDYAVDVKINAGRALAELKALQASNFTVNADVTPNLGAFRSKLRSELAAAASALPNIRIEADTGPAIDDVLALREMINSLNERIRLGLDDAIAKSEILELKAMLTAIGKTTLRPEIKFDIDKANAALGSAFAEILKKQRADVDKQSGFLAAAIKKQLRDAVAGIPPVKLDADTDPARRKLEELQAEARALLTDIDLNPDVNVVEAFAKIKALSTALRAISDNKGVDIGIRADTGKFLAQMKAITARDFSVTAEVQPRLGEFREKVRAELEAARASLPSLMIDLTAHLDDKNARFAIDELDQRLAHLNHDIRVGMNGVEAEAELAKIEAEFEKLSHTKINPELEVDIAAALEHVRAAMSETGRRSGVSFGNEFQDALRAAFANLPDPRIDADFGILRGELAEIKREMSALSDVRIGVDMDAAGAFVKLRELQDRLVYLSTKGATVELRVAAAKAFADLEGFLAQVNSSKAEVKIEGDIGEFRTKVVAAIEEAQKGLPEIRAGIDLTGASAELAEFRARLGATALQLKIDGDATAARAEITKIMLEAKALLRTGATLEIKADIRGLLRDLALARAATLGVGAAFDESSGGISRMRLILAAVLLLLPLIAGAILALPALLSLVLLPIVAILAGIDGIKKAFGDLSPEITAIREAASLAFQNTLMPGVAATQTLLQAMPGPIAALSAALGTATSDILTFLASGEQLSRLKTIFTDMGPAISALTPAIESFLGNFLRLTELGLPALETFGVQLSRVGADFEAMIARLSSTGVAQDAISALFQVLSSLIGLIGPLTEIGAVIFASFGPALAVAIDGVGMALSALAGFINMIVGALGPAGPAVSAVITTLLLFQVTMFALGTSAPAIFTKIAGSAALMGTGIGVACINGIAQIKLLGVAFVSTATQVKVLATAVATGSIGMVASFKAAAVAATTMGRGIGVAAGAAGRSMLALAGGPMGAAIIGIVVAMGLLGQAQAAADEQTAKLQASLSTLSTVLDGQGGKINDISIKAADYALATSGAADAAKELGIQVTGMGESALSGGQGLDDLKTKLQGIVDAGHSSVGSLGDLVQTALPFLKDGASQAADKAKLLLEALNGVGDAAKIAAAKHTEMVTTLQNEGQSFVNGIPNAKQYSDAVAKLGEEATTVADNVKALKDAIDALTNNFVSDQQALSDFEEAIDKIPDALKKIKEEAKGAGNSVFDAAGQINQASVAGRDFWDVAKGIADKVPAAAVAMYNMKGGFNNIEVSAPAAAAEVQKARDAIIKMGIDAGGSKKAAEGLADSMGLIPSVVQILFENKDLPQVNQDFIELGNKIRAVPGQKTITVDALSDGALKVLEGLGIKIKALPEGKFEIEVAPGVLEKIDGVGKYITSQSPAMPVDANVGPVADTVNAKIAELERQKAELPVQARFERQELDTAIGQLKATRTDLTFGADISLFGPTVNAAVAAINASQPKINIGGKPEEAFTALATVLAAVEAGKPFVTINGHKEPVQQALAEVLTNITNSKASVTINGVDVPARDVLRETLAAIHAGKDNVTIAGVDAPARDVLRQLLSSIGLSKESVTALLNDQQAINDLANLTRTRSMTVNVSYAAIGGTELLRQSHGGAIGGIVKGYRDGGIEPFATGGVGVKLTPMRGGLAQRVKANSWRVIGDRVSDDEAYIPINSSARSHALLDYTAQAMGRDIAPQATGSLLGAMTSTANLAARLRKAALATQTAGSFAGRARLANQLGGDTRSIEAKLDRIAALLAENGQRPMNVNLTAINPVAESTSSTLTRRLRNLADMGALQ